jgi:hypothetical protein
MLLSLNLDEMPQSCLRNVTGTATYKVAGWFYTNKTVTVALLLPTTIINLTTLIVLLTAMFMGEKLLYEMDPTDPQSLLLAPTEVLQDGAKIKLEVTRSTPRRWVYSWSPHASPSHLLFVISGPLSDILTRTPERRSGLDICARWLMKLRCKISMSWDAQPGHSRTAH